MSVFIDVYMFSVPFDWGEIFWSVGGQNKKAARDDFPAAT
jgi:hypothetical protein